MYAMTGKLNAQADRRGELVEILTQAAQLVSGLAGCRMYIVCEELANANAVCVFEIWDDKEAHDASLKDGQVRSLIAQARHLLNGAPEGAELHVVSGHGI